MDRSVKSALAVWLVLMLSTAASTWGFSRPSIAPLVCTLAVMVIAAIKVSLVMTHFMELRGAPRPWQIAGATWTIVAAGSVIGFYLMKAPPLP